MSIQSSISGMIGSIAGLMKAKKIIGTVEQTAATATIKQPTETKIKMPNEEPIDLYIGKEKLDPALAAKIMEKVKEPMQKAETSLFKAQTEKRTTRNFNDNKNLQAAQYYMNINRSKKAIGYREDIDKGEK